MVDPLDSTTTTTAGTETGADPTLGKQTGSESSLSNWVGPYVTDMLGKGEALANMDYQAYTGPLTAGESAAQQAAFSGIAGLTIPTDQMGTFTPSTFTAETAQQYMNPYLQAALQPQIDEARRQAQITRLGDAGRLTRAGAFGGSRQAIMESELNRNMLQNLAGITGEGYRTAYDKAVDRFDKEQARQQEAQTLANQYGLAALTKQADLGAQQRDIESEGIAADYAQFKEERDFPYKQVQYQQSLLQGLPLAAQSYTYQQPSQLTQLLNLLGGATGGLDDILAIFGDGGSGMTNPDGSTPENSIGLPLDEDEDIAGGAPE
jgi:hypothetical protein